MNVTEPTDKHLAVLRKYFGHTQFRPMQWKIIYSILEKKKDNCVIMATGYGKSLCYQYPAVFCDGLSIIISPLISLMQDQVFSLNMSNISACYLGSAQFSKRESMADIFAGRCRIVYVTPELCTSESGTEILTQIKAAREITLIAIDEAHCVSQWGHDFRSSYRKLGALREIFDTVPILAVTATATPQVRIDICKSLRLCNALVTCTSFDRPNLYFSVSLKSGKIDESFRDFQKILVRKGLSYSFPGPTIIYCLTKKKTEEVANILNENGILCAPYHAGISLNKRKEVHEKFLKNKLSVVVATVAFGMGIDKPDVRCVIHYGAPKEIESYYQEVGRAGRDGLPATCYVFYSSTDFNTNNYLIQSSSNQKFQEYRMRMAKHLQKYLETRNCRRSLLLSYFDKSAVSEPEVPSQNCCDNCTKLLESGRQTFIQPKLDLSDEVKLLLKVFDLFQGRYGMTVPIKFLRGYQDNKIPKEKTCHELFGFGKDTSDAAWKALARLCLREGLLEEKTCGSSFRDRKFPMSTIKLTSAGKQYIKIGEKCGVELIPNKEVETLFRRRKKLEITSTVQNRDEVNFWKDKLKQYRSNNKDKQKEKEKQAELYAVLRKLRDHLAFTNKVPSQMVATDQMCYNMAVNVPSDEIKLAEIDGFNEARVIKYGDYFIRKIAEFFNKSNEPLEEKAGKDLLHENNENLEDILEAEFLKENAVDYGKIDTNYMEYELNESELKEFDNDLTVSTSPVTNTVDDFWGDDNDEELFQNIPLEKFENFAQSSNSPQKENANETECKHTVLNANTTNYDVHEELDETECEHVVLNANAANYDVHKELDDLQKEFQEKCPLEISQTKSKRKFVYDDDNSGKSVNVLPESKQKRNFPSCLVKPGCAKVIKNKVQVNSLFKF